MQKEDTGQSGHLPNLIRVFTLRSVVTYGSKHSLLHSQTLISVSTTVVMDGTLGTGTFKPEKNLVFFQDKKSRYP